MNQTVYPNCHGLRGAITVPGDKSISHRAVMFGAIAEGVTTIEGFLPSEDCLRTVACFRALGVNIVEDGCHVRVVGKGFAELTEPTVVLDVGNSGTTLRLLLGILAGRPFHATLVGDASIARRPMARVTRPLKEMGATIDGRKDGQYAPLALRGRQLTAHTYASPVASAQVKSALLFAGLQAEGTTTVSEPYVSRDHTEQMLNAFGVELQRNGPHVSVSGGQALQAQAINVPGDISSAAFFLVAATLVPNSEIILNNVGVNPTRAGVLNVLKEIGGEWTLKDEQLLGGEPRGNIHVRHAAQLKPFHISGEQIPTLIDEIPVLAVLATQIEGTSVICDAAELKVKETNRIATVISELTKLGARIEETEDGMIIYGGTRLHGGVVQSHGDHRLAMALAVAALIAKKEVVIEDSEAVDVSYPSFFTHLSRLSSR
ncbi:3-phosphoshikimate 1-carboxyvinyltransferase [Bacillus sp. FSL W7-1360]